MLALLLALIADTATIRVTASIESYATVEVEGDCARLASNSDEALAWLGDVPLVANDSWTCIGPDERLALNGAR